MAPNYHVERVDGLVETWATQALSFQPKDWRREWREKLKEELLQLGRRDGAAPTPGDGGFLAARYESPVRDHNRDAENVLFYNVGGAFASSTRSGLRFERLYSTPSAPPVELSGRALHYLRYEIAAPRAAFYGWQESKLLAEFDGIELPRIGSESKPVLVWFPLREAALPLVALADPRAEFALRLRAEIPLSAGSAASFVKPIFDGVIAAFQAHDGSQAAAIAAWMERSFATKLRGLNAARIAGLLADDSMAALGRYCIFDRHGDGFACDPEDDRCVAGELQVARVAGRTGFRLSGTLHSVEARPWSSAARDAPKTG